MTTMNSNVANERIGKIIQVIGPVVDVEFPSGQLPEIYNALKIMATNPAGQEINLVTEVQVILGDNRVRSIAMSSTEGLTRSMQVIDTGAPISVPVGEATLGRIMNVLGEPVDEAGDISAVKQSSIHREPPSLSEQNTNIEVFETGIKVIDLLTPYVKGGKTILNNIQALCVNCNLRKGSKIED